ncbi:MAG: pyridoxal phosphate-dependent aminotransferase [Candidatus Hydrogenedens sp.]
MYISKRFENYELSGGLNPIAEAHRYYISQGKELFDLTLSNPTKANFLYPETEILQALSKSQSLLYEPTPKGSYEARETISLYYSSLGFSVSVDDIFLTSGTSEGYSYIIKLICNPDDEILVPAPSYPLLDFIASLELVKVVPYHFEEQNNSWFLSTKNIINSVNNKTKLLFLVQPNNPTGNILSHVEIHDLLSFAEEYNLVIVVDEVFRDYLFSNESPHLFSSSQIPIFTLNGISKTLALPQLKLSWFVCSCPENRKKELYEGLEIIADTYLSVNTPVQVALADLFQIKDSIQIQIQNRISNNLKYAITQFSKCPYITSYPPQGGWYLVIKISNTIESEEKLIIDLLNQTGVYVHPGGMFRFPDNNFYMILSLLPEENIFQEGIQRIIKYFS